MTTNNNNNTWSRWDDPMGRYAHSYLVQADLLLGQLKKLSAYLTSIMDNNNNNADNKKHSSAEPGIVSPTSILTTKVELLITRLEQQILLGNRLRKIIEHYSGASNLVTSHQLQRDADIASWCAVASQVKSALAGFLQQVRLDILCATSVLMYHERQTAVKHTSVTTTASAIDFDHNDPAEIIVRDIARSFFTVNNEVYKLVAEVASPLIDQASTSVSSVMDSMMTFSSPTSAKLGSPRQLQQQQPYSTSSATSSQYQPQQQQKATGGSSSATMYRQQQGKDQQQQQQTVISLNSSCQEYLNAVARTADPVITALSVAVRGNERLHGTHVEIFRGLFSNVVLGLIRRHSLLTGAVRLIRDISQKYHRIVQGQNALIIIRQSISLQMGDGDSVPEPDEKLVEVDGLGRLLQEVLATATVMKESCTVLRHWNFESINTAPNKEEDQQQQQQTNQSKGKAVKTSSFLTNTSQTRTMVAQQHTKTNGQYLLSTLRSMSSLLRRVAAACEKALASWSEPALSSFGKILEIHSAPLLQCARVVANAQTDMKQLMGIMREKAIQVEETRAIEDTLAVLGNANTNRMSSPLSGGGSPSFSANNTSIILTSLDQQLKEIETVARTIHNIATKSTGILSEVVTTLCKPIAQNSIHLPFQYVDSEIQTLATSRQQLCQQHDKIIENLKATATMSSTNNNNNNNNDNNNSNAEAMSPNALSLEEMTSPMNSSRLMNETEQRAVAASCSFVRLSKMCDEIDHQCDLWFKSRYLLKTQGAESERLDDDSLATAAPTALLPYSVRNEDRTFSMNVLRGTMKHLEAGEQSFFVVPRPDRVSSPAALNEFEDDFSVAFVGVEGLCDQVFSSSSSSSSSSGPPISIHSASSLDVLAKVAQLASGSSSAGVGNHHHHHHGNKSSHHHHHKRSNSGNSVDSSSHGGGMSSSYYNYNPTISITGVATTTETAASDNNNNNLPVVQQQLATARRMRSQTTVIRDQHMVASLFVNGNHATPASASLLAQSSTGNSNNFPDDMRSGNISSFTHQMRRDSIRSNNTSNPTTPLVVNSSTSLSINNNSKTPRSFTYQAAMAMPEHEMVPQHLNYY